MWLPIPCSSSKTLTALAGAIAIKNAVEASAGEPRLQTRVGLNTGDLVEGEGDMFGTVVNNAARVTAVAQPREISVSDATRARVGGSTEFTFPNRSHFP